MILFNSSPTEREKIFQVNNDQITDTISEPDIEEVLDLTVQLCQTPIAMISVKDKSKVWYKAVEELALEKIPVDVSLFESTSESHQVVQIRDTFLDPQFSTHSLVTGPPNIRFYASTPLLSLEGDALGTLYVLDVAPRTLSEDQLRGLKCLARQVVYQLEISKQKKELVQAWKEAAEAKKAKEQSLSNLSLEVRTSMNGIFGMTKLLLEESLPQSQKELVSGINDSSSLLFEALRGLDVYRMEAENLPFKHVNFDLSRTLRVIQTSFSAKAQEKGIDFIVTLDPRLPNTLAGDPLRLNQILMNTVDNAIKFTEKGGVGLHISLKEMTGKGPKVLFSVNDTGIGIPAARLKTISAELRQPADSNSQAPESTGRGLSLTKKLVEQYDGQIQVDSLQKKGSCFTFDLQFSHQIRHAEGEDFTQTLKILVADDSKANQLVAGKWLEKLGHQVDVAGNGKEAVEMNCSNDYDVILMDLQMPVMDGIEATRSIRKESNPVKQNVCIIALTASLMDHVIVACKEAGMDHFIPKPFEPRKLEQQIKKVLQARQESTELVFMSECL